MANYFNKAIYGKSIIIPSKIIQALIDRYAINELKQMTELDLSMEAIIPISYRRWNNHWRCGNTLPNSDV